MSPRAVLLAGLAALAIGAGACGDDEADDPTDPPSVRSGEVALLRVTSTDFIDGGRLAQKFTCDGAGEEPAVFAGTVPAGTKELVVVMSDPDATGGTFTHLTRFGLSPRGDGDLSEGGEEGANSTGAAGWAPPCPPPGTGTHRYVWTVYALREQSGLEAGASPAQVQTAVRDPAAGGAITALYAR